MNRVRKQAALQARALAAVGFGVLIVDLFGTGDSDGNFADARWEIWLDDLLRGATWLQQRGHSSLVLWGARLGGLLAADALESLADRVEQLLLWQPVVSGRTHLRQFLRMRVAAEMIAGNRRANTANMWQEFEQGNSIEVAGFDVAAELAREIDARDLGQCNPSRLPSVIWIEAVNAENRPLPTPSRRVVDQWRSAGVRVCAETLVGEQFWSTPEITVVPGLVERSCRNVQEACQ